jgi:N-acetyl-gamma-glutamyl-phosphate reductase
MSKIKVGIINVTGYAGVELARLLHQHPEVELISVTGRSAAGKRLGEIFPHLASLDLVIQA